MRICFACLALALLCSGALPSSATAAASPKALHALYSRDGVDVWAVGEAGLIRRSFDGGATWTEQTLGTGALRGVVAPPCESPCCVPCVPSITLVGDGGKIWHSGDNGGSWTSTTIAGAPALRAIEMPIGGDQVGYVVGDAGTILKTLSGGGGSWFAQSSGTTRNLRAVRFVSLTDGWAAGDQGTLLKTTDGGANWTPVATGSSGDFLALDVYSSEIWVVGARGVARRSIDGGANWTPIKLRMDSQSDVRAVWLDAGSVWLAGGGGFIRHSTDGGATWTFAQHRMQGKITDLFFVGSSGWACNRSNPSVLRTLNSGATWNLPPGVTQSWAWDFVLGIGGGTVRGSTFGLGPDPNVIYCALGDQVYRSSNEGVTWTPVGNPMPAADATNAFVISPKNANLMVAAVTATFGGIGDHLVKTTDGGLNWNVVMVHEYGEYGIPLEMDPDEPDTLYFGGDASVLQRSTDFGTTWAPFSATSFVSPCDIIAVPESDSGVFLVADGVTGVGTGRLLRSNNGGLTFTVQNTVSGSEIPGLAMSRLDNTRAFGTAWSSGGVRRSTNQGLTWPEVHNAGSAWGVDIARDDPNCVIFGTYSGADGYLAFDGGAAQSSFFHTGLSGTNYSFLALDREVILAEEADGIEKLRALYSDSPNNTQSVSLISPNGGENWMGESMHTIQWSSQNLGVATLEYRLSPSQPWQYITNLVGYTGNYVWTVPNQATTEARVRVRDAWDGTPEDFSSADFTITRTTDVAASDAARFGLKQNVPNPLVRSTRIQYQIPEAGPVSLEVFDLAGHRVAVLVHERQAAGAHSVAFEPGGGGGGRATHLASGVYFYRLQAGGFVATRKMLFLP